MNVLEVADPDDAAVFGEGDGVVAGVSLGEGVFEELRIETGYFKALIGRAEELIGGTVEDGLVGAVQVHPHGSADRGGPHADDGTGALDVADQVFTDFLLVRRFDV